MKPYQWKNVDDITYSSPDHRTLIVGDFGSTGVVKPGESYEFTFTDVGHVECHLSRIRMKGTLEYKTALDEKFGKYMIAFNFFVLFYY